MNHNHRSQKITASLILSILSCLISFFTLMYSIQKDNREIITLWCFEYQCSGNSDDGYWTSGTYIINNVSHKNISIIDAYLTYNRTRINTGIDTKSIIPIIIDAGGSYKISLSPVYSSYYLQPSLLELHITSSTNRHYLVDSGR